jgi:ABC-type Co2+ transport system permease subunit
MKLVSVSIHHVGFGGSFVRFIWALLPLLLLLAAAAAVVVVVVVEELSSILECRSIKRRRCA